jgi:hypothetical protein
MNTFDLPTQSFERGDWVWSTPATSPRVSAGRLLRVSRVIAYPISDMKIYCFWNDLNGKHESCFSPLALTNLGPHLDNFHIWRQCIGTQTPHVGNEDNFKPRMYVTNLQLAERYCANHDCAELLPILHAMLEQKHPNGGMTVFAAIWNS